MKLDIKIKHIGVVLLGMITFSACDSYIEEDIFSDITSENFIDEGTADQLVVGVYSTLREVYKDYNLQFLGTDLFTVKAELNAVSAVNDYFGFDSGVGGSLWTKNYNVVAKANTAINRYENQISWSESKLGDKAYGIAQAKALRALAFFNMVQQYGGLVLDLEEPTSIRSDYTRSSEEETYSLIISDLEDAIPVLLDEPETGRFSKRAAQHLLSEVYLTRAYTSFGSTDDFNTAAALAEEAIGSYDIRSQSFAEVFAYDNQENDEILFAIQWGTNGLATDQVNTKHSIFMNQVANYPGVNRTTTPYGFSDFNAMPTPFFYSLLADNDSRDEATLHRAILADGDEPEGPDPIVAGDTIVYYPKVALDAVELAERLDRYWVYQPDQYLFGQPENVPGVNYLYSLNPERTNFPIFKKFDDEIFSEATDGARDTFVFRVAGTHLLAAEAYLGAGNPSAALTHLNIVRERATGVANEYTSVTIDDILDERAVELAGEANRWAVLKRTGKLEERINAHNPHVQDHGAFDPNVHLLRPIPSSELELSDGSLTQNPGY
ncbi:RagB/SusD family nutrient uptake outer membrane protein [uncultured Zobellia sp.]|uniref:RagB/SusD family nutrient uptake outer membrane protein n=1 Tax=uncultured Zobellia sp. TaxID=255433 RepID=UPI0025948857|nr:RagB/SusD family nutrient uptake outer membrane protein [uncultured Zobellia sp.]